MSMIDAIVIFPVATVLACACTPAETGPDGLVMVYARADSIDAWAGLEVLASAPYAPDEPGELGEAVYSQVFADPVKLARYREFYDPQPATDPETGETTSPPAWFGVLA